MILNPAVLLVLFTGIFAVTARGDIRQVATRPANQGEPEEVYFVKQVVTATAEQAGPTKVYFFIFVLDIDEIDGAAQSFTANFFIRVRWLDERLADPTSVGIRRIPIDEIWGPGIMVANQQGILRTSLPEVADVNPEGMVMYRQRYVGTLSQPLDLSKFPLDQHVFIIQMIAIGHGRGDLEFLPDTISRGRKPVHAGAISDELSLPDWRILTSDALSHPYEPIPNIYVDGFAFEFTAKRNFPYYLFQVIVPLAVVVGMSWAAFWIDPSQTGAQIGVATSAILSLIAFKFVLSGLLPKLPYMTRLDYFMLGSTLLVFFAMGEVVVTSMLSHKGRGTLARRFDTVSRIVFPVTFLTILLLSMLA